MTDAAHILPSTSAMRGSNQSGLRAWNERLFLTLLRSQGPMAKADIARLTGLSAQTVSVIFRALEQDGLLERGDPVRGRVGQPSVPMALAAGGAYFLGFKIGRRSSEMILTDFHGHVRARETLRHEYPEPVAVTEFGVAAAGRLVASLPIAHQARVAGLGIAQPFQLWDWSDAIGAPQAVMDHWRDYDLCAQVQARLPYPVFLRNDASAACGAELVFGAQSLPKDFVYFYVGFFIGGGVVLNGGLHTGASGNSGALGSMPVRAPDGQIVQLIDVASIAVLEQRLRQAGLSPDLLWQDPENWPVPDDLVQGWIDQAAQAVAQAVVATLAVIDFQAVVIDGWMPTAIRARFVVAASRALARLNLAGLTPPGLVEGSLGSDARALGAAALPLTDRFLIAPEAGLGQEHSG